MTILKGAFLTLVLILTLGVSATSPAWGQETKSVEVSKQLPLQLPEEDLEIVKMLQLLEMMNLLQEFEIVEAMENSR